MKAPSKDAYFINHSVDATVMMKKLGNSKVKVQDRVQMEAQLE